MISETEAIVALEKVVGCLETESCGLVCEYCEHNYGSCVDALKLAIEDMKEIGRQKILSQP